MTTITNFIEGNFIPNPSPQFQNPIWTLTAHSSQRSLPLLKKSFMMKCEVDKKIVIHVDLGISSVKDSSKYEGKIIQLENGLKLRKPQSDVPYFFVQITVLEKYTKNNYLDQLTEQLRQVVENKSPKFLQEAKQFLKTNQPSYGLLIEGLHCFNLIPTKSSELESFIRNIASLRFPQINIITNYDLLTAEQLYCLQRISNCLSYARWVEDKWIVRSTVRRYTGYSNEEEYHINIANQQTMRVKVSKKKIIKQEETAEQKELLGELGFGIKKQRQNYDPKIKAKIFPHLQIIENENKKCEGCDVQCGCMKQEEQNLIILDDEQEDEDDVDV